MKTYTTKEIERHYNTKRSVFLKLAREKGVKPCDTLGTSKNVYLFSDLQIANILDRPIEISTIIRIETVWNIYQSKMNIK